MLTTNCALAYLTNRLRIKEEYGLCEETTKKLVQCFSSYYWLYNNAWDCLTADQQCDLDVFIKSNLNGIFETTCSDGYVNCSGLASGNIVANLSNATNYNYSFTISPLAGTAPYTYSWSTTGGTWTLNNGTTSSSFNITNADILGTISDTYVNCIIRDVQGCQVTRNYYIYCTPYLVPTLYNGLCVSGFTIDLNAIVNAAFCGTTIDWPSTQFQLPAGISSATMSGSNAVFIADGSIATYGIQVRIKTIAGFYSNWSTLTATTAAVC